MGDSVVGYQVWFFLVFSCFNCFVVQVICGVFQFLGMIKGKELLGCFVVVVSNGVQVDNVYDVVFDYQGNWVLVLFVEEGGWFRVVKVVLFGCVQLIGEKVVMIVMFEDVVNMGCDLVLKEVFVGKINLIGMMLLIIDGQMFGKIIDVYFDECSGQVEGYEVLGGLFVDMINGCIFIFVL